MQKCALINKDPNCRTSVIYESQGRAREYSELAANLYSGCDHGCIYCYAPLATRKKREIFSKPSMRKEVLLKFRRDALILKERRESRPVLLSFTTDPYQHLDVDLRLTRTAIQILHSNNLKVSILTKGGIRSERDFDLLSEHPELSAYGATLVFCREDMRIKIEPNAAPTNQRIASLEKAHRLGIPTYVSLEPVWSPEDSLKLIDMTHGFVDLFKVGKLNYHNQQKNVNWSQFREDAIDKLEHYGKEYYIKKDLALCEV
jgi:DNA repair photolyase